MLLLDFFSPNFLPFLNVIDSGIPNSDPSFKTEDLFALCKSLNKLSLE